ncbi:MAG: hypothetical protein EXS63_04745 [Candidatus Omnitrophica bacterium]|nr:hypothetical protein [Candidatus Omnitrophota bacterium]
MSSQCRQETRLTLVILFVLLQMNSRILIGYAGNTPLVSTDFSVGTATTLVSTDFSDGTATTPATSQVETRGNTNLSLSMDSLMPGDPRSQATKDSDIDSSVSTETRTLGTRSTETGSATATGTKGAITSTSTGVATSSQTETATNSGTGVATSASPQPATLNFKTPGFNNTNSNTQTSNTVSTSVSNAVVKLSTQEAAVTRPASLSETALSSGDQGFTPFEAITAELDSTRLTVDFQDENTLMIQVWVLNSQNPDGLNSSKYLLDLKEGMIRYYEQANGGDFENIESKINPEEFSKTLEQMVFKANGAIREAFKGQIPATLAGNLRLLGIYDNEASGSVPPGAGGGMNPFSRSIQPGDVDLDDGLESNQDEGGNEPDSLSSDRPLQNLLR